MDKFVKSLPNLYSSPFYNVIRTIENSFLKTLFPFTLSQATKNISEDVFKEYEIATKKLARKLEDTAKLLAVKEGKEPNADYQLKLLKQIKNNLDD